MADIIKLVHGDTLPKLQLTLTDSVTLAPINLTGATVYLHARALKSSTLAFTNTLQISDAINGKCVVAWAPTDLVRAPGDYEAEIEVVFLDTTRETVYDFIFFNIRNEIGPTPSESIYPVVP